MRTKSHQGRDECLSYTKATMYHRNRLCKASIYHRKCVILFLAGLLCGRLLCESDFFVANRDNLGITEDSVNQSKGPLEERWTKQPIPPAAGRAHDREYSLALFLILPSSIGNGSGERKAESPKAVAPTTAGPGYHLAPGNTLESHRRHKPLPTSNHEQRGRNTTATTAARCRGGETLQPGGRGVRGGQEGHR